MKLLIGTKGVRELKSKFGDKKILYNSVIIKEGEKESKIFEITFKNKDILDRTEIDIFNYIKKNCGLIEVVKFSKGFKDLHKVGKTPEFEESLKILRKKITPLYIRMGRKKQYWWIGIDNHKKDFDIEEMTKEIYRCGLGLGLICLDLIRR